MKAIIHTPTNKLENSIEFYSLLGFTDVSSDGTTLFSDGQVLIEINPDRYARAGVKLIKDDWSEVAANLEQIAPIFSIDQGYILSDGTGTWIYLIENKSFTHIDYSTCGKSIIGTYAGLSLETISIPHTMKVWEVLGFTQSMGSPDQGWLSMSHPDGPGISLMNPNACPHLFFNPSLTYFNGKDNPKIISEIRKRDIPIAEEVTHFNKEGIVDNVILRDPGGYGFFIFND